MKFLYIDKANSIEDIRIAERTIWAEEMLSLGHHVHFFLISTTENRSLSHKENQDIINTSKSLIITIFLFIFKLPIIIYKVKPEIVVVRNVLDLGLIAFAYSKIFRIKIMYIKAFPYLEVKSYKSNDLLKHILRLMIYFETWLMNQVDFLLIRTEKFKTQLEHNYNIARKSLIVPMGIKKASINSISEKDKDQIKLEMGLDKEYIGIYFGAIDKMRNMDFLLEVLAKVYLEKRNLNFLIIGGDEKESMLLSKDCTKRNLNISVFSNMARNQLFKIIQICDFSVSPIPPITEYILSSPTKVVESLGLGCPVIVNKEIIDQNEVVVRSEGGIAVDYSAESFTKEIVNVLNGHYDLNKMAIKGENYVSDNRSYSKMAENIITFIESGKD